VQFHFDTVPAPGDERVHAHRLGVRRRIRHQVDGFFTISA
jgi:hypothetical protein